MFLDGPAFVWAGTLANDADWAQLRESFATRFINDPTLQYCFRQEFDSRMQGTHESVELYVNDIRRLGAKLNKPDGELRDKLMRGLLPVYRAFVLSQQPATANEVEEKAKIAELVEQTKAPQTQPAPQVVNAVSYDRDGIKELTALIRKQGEQQAALQQQLNDLQMKQGTQYQQGAQYQQGPRYQQGPHYQREPQNQRGPQRQQQPKTCFYCGKIGHIKRDCRLLKSHQQNQYASTFQQQPFRQNHNYMGN